MRNLFSFDIDIKEMMPFCSYSVVVADPDDPLKTTDQTRHLGLIVSML